MNELIIFYDISNDKIRTKIVKLLDSYGIRIQKSVYSLNVSNMQYKEIKRKLNYYTINTDSVIILELKVYKKIVFGTYVENDFEKDMIF